jgi:hypothetical protein
LAVTLAVIPQAKIGMSAVTGGSYGGTVGTRLEITNWNEVMKVLVKLDKDYVKQLRKDFRAIAKPVQKEIKSAIPSKSKPPLSGMRQVHFGRLAWGSSFGAGHKPSKSVLIQTPNTRKKAYRGKEIAIVRLQVGSPATVLADMAGRRGGSKGRKGMTPLYDYMYTMPDGSKVPGKRRHRVVPGNFLGSLMSARFVKQRWASRFVWPAAEKALPQAQRQMDMAISAVNLRVNALLRSK